MPRRSNRPRGRTAGQRRGRPHGTSRSGLPGRRDLDDDVGRLDDTDGLVTDLEIEFLDGFGRHEADEPMRTGDDFDDGSHAIAFDPGDDAREAVSRGLGHDRPVRYPLAAL